MRFFDLALEDDGLALGLLLLLLEVFLFLAQLVGEAFLTSFHVPNVGCAGFGRILGVYGEFPRRS